ncbi:nuclease-related domain-containing protein [Klebsiella quasipneumoniae]|uniref:nuclease-related domain-containing protein n=1 Tax=Klebsiella quasipneumoniae TaxID=1463165 RepID=UPI0038796712
MPDGPRQSLRCPPTPERHQSQRKRSETGHRKRDKRFLDDVTLVVSEGDTTQIDHIVVAPTGIFVVETKFYKGRIYGKESDKQWTQKIFKNTYKFQNPFRQNYKHVKAIEALLPNIGLANIHSVVVMLGECEWASKDRPAALFTSGWKAADYINDMIASGQKVLDVEEASARLQSLRLNVSRKAGRGGRTIAEAVNRHSAPDFPFFAA